MPQEKKETKEYGDSALTLHRKIKGAIEGSVKQSDFPCVLVPSIEKKVRCDPRTVAFHLKLLEEDGYGKLSKDRKLFCVTRTSSST